MWKKVILFGLLTAFILTSGASAKTIERDYMTEKICEKGKCSIKSFSGVEFVPEDKEWVYIQEAARLDDKNIFQIKYVTEDHVHDIEVTRFNYTCIDFTPTVIDDGKFEYGEPVDIKIDGITIAYVTKPSKAIKDIPMTRCFQDSVFLHTLSFGKESTTIEIGYGSNDGYIRDTNCDDSPVVYPGYLFYIGTHTIGSGRIYRSYVDFDTSSIPDDATIDSAYVSFWVYANTLDASYDVLMYNCDYGTLGTEDWTVSLGDYEGVVGTSTTTVDAPSNITVIDDNIVKDGTTQYCLVYEGSCADIKYRLDLFYAHYYPVMVVEYTETGPSGPCWHTEAGLLSAPAGCVVYDDDGDGILGVSA